MELRPITPTRLQVKGWARVGPAGAHTLRRGAWYPVVRISSSNIVVLDVNRHNVPVDRRFLEIRYHPPERWTIAFWGRPEEVTVAWKPRASASIATKTPTVPAIPSTASSTSRAT